MAWEAGQRLGIGDQTARNIGRIGRGLGGGVQAKPSVGAVDDPLEAEADRIADRVMRRSGSAGMGGAGRQNTRSEHEGSSDLARELPRGAGRPLDSSARA